MANRYYNNGEDKNGNMVNGNCDGIGYGGNSDRNNETSQTSNDGGGYTHTLFQHYNMNDSMPTLNQSLNEGYKQENLDAYRTHPNSTPVSGLQTQYSANVSNTFRSDAPKRKLSSSNRPTNYVKASPIKPTTLSRPEPIRQSSFPIAKPQFSKSFQEEMFRSQSPNLQYSFSASNTPDEFNNFFDFSGFIPEYGQIMQNNPSQNENRIRGSHSHNHSVDSAKELLNANKPHRTNYNASRSLRNISQGSNGLPEGYKDDILSEEKHNFNTSSKRNKTQQNNYNIVDPPSSGQVPKKEEPMNWESKQARNPGFHIPLDDLNYVDARSSTFTSLPLQECPSEVQSNYNNLQILEPDLDSFDQQDSIRYNTIITPSMKPPGSNINDYFEVYTGSQNELESQHKVSQEKDMGSYLYPSNNFHFNDGSSFETVQEDHHSDLSGFNFDVNLRTDESISQKLEPVSFKPIDVTSFNYTPESSEQGESEDNESILTYLNLPESKLNAPDTDGTATNSIVSSTKEKTNKKRNPKGAVCSICDKYISRDLTRHMRIHNEIGRFQCVYPKAMCNHKTQYFNRPYDYKKHLLHMHFKFNDPKGKAANTLTDKLPLSGTCHACGSRFIAADWLENHVLTNDVSQKCSYIEGK